MVNGELFKILGVLGGKPLARLLFSLCPLCLCGEKSYSEILLSAIYGRINYYPKMACFEPCQKLRGKT